MSSIGLRINNFIEKYIFVFVIVVMLIGLALGERLHSYQWLVGYLFALVTLSMAIGCNIQHIKEVLLHPFKIAVLIVALHIILPLFVYWISGYVFGYSSDYVIGIVMFTLIPVGISSIIWISMSGGSLSFILAFVVIDSLLSPIVITGGIMLLFQQHIEMNTLDMLIDLLLIVVVPTIVGILANEWTKGKVVTVVKPYSAPISKVIFLIVIALNASALATSVEQLKGDLIKIIPFTAIIVILTYLFGYFIAFNQGKQMKITMAYAAGIRNVSLGAVIALTYFTPQTAVPILVGILLQQPLATVVNVILQKLNNVESSQT